MNFFILVIVKLFSLPNSRPNSAVKIYQVEIQKEYLNNTSEANFSFTQE